MTIPETMRAVVLTGHGGPERLVYREDVPVPHAAPGEVLIAVGASSVNNTDINTRTGWYSKAVSGATDAGAADGYGAEADADGSWSGVPLQFPRIQGADCCGRIVAVGAGVDTARMGERVLVRALYDPDPDGAGLTAATFGSERDGAFAAFTTARATDALAVQSDLSDLELASFPCAFSTAEGMLAGAQVGAERVLITGASGGVGAAAVQLAARRGAEVIAMTSAGKADALRALGAAEIIGRGDVPASANVDVVLDLVGGEMWPGLIDTLRPGGRYVVAGAIAGPMVSLDLRTLYLRDLSFLGCTAQPSHILPDLIGYIERGEIVPSLAQSFDLTETGAAQDAFLRKTHVGKIGIGVARE